MQRFKSMGQAQGFLGAHAAVSGELLFRLPLEDRKARGSACSTDSP